jgi:arylsulfatase A-like enzyme
MIKDWKLEAVVPEITNKAVDYIKQNAEKKQPFFLYFALTSPHVPIAPDEDFKGTSKAGAYGDFVQETDWAVSQIIAAVKNAGISDNTIIIFTSDNGSPGQDGTKMSGEMNSVLKYEHFPNAPFKGMKTDLWEGGHHVPFIVSWPSKIKANTISTETICHSDLLATCADILKIPIPLKEAEDSYSLLSLLLDEKNNYERPYTIHHSGTGVFAIRQGDWKLIMTGNSGGGLIPSKAELINGVPVPLQLYNMKNDLQEANNLYLVYPEKVKELKNLLLQAKNSNGTKYSIRRKY